MAIILISTMAAGCNPPPQGGGVGGVSKQDIGTVLGGVGGGVIGSTMGGGNGRIATTIAGTVLGGLAGNSIGKSLDNGDAASRNQNQ